MLDIQDLIAVSSFGLTAFNLGYVIASRGNNKSQK